MAPSVQDEQSAIELDELILLHSKVNNLIADKNKAG